MSPKPQPRQAAEPTATPAAKPPHDRRDAPEHPWDSDVPEAPPTPQNAAQAPAPPTGREPAPAGARSSARAPVRPRARARGPAIDAQHWQRLVTTEARKVAAARRKLDTRQAELDTLLNQVRHAGVTDDQVEAWLTEAGLDPGGHRQPTPEADGR